MEKPRIYGNEGRSRTAVTRAINSGDDPLAHDEGEEWPRHALEELRELQSALTPPKRSASKRAPEAPEPAPRADGSWFRPSWWKLGTAGSIASLVGVPLGIAAIVLAFVLRPGAGVPVLFPLGARAFAPP